MEAAKQGSMSGQWPWRTVVRVIGGKRVTFVLRGYGSGAEYMTDGQGLPIKFNAKDARAAIAKQGSAA